MATREKFRWQFVGYICEVFGLMIWVGGLLMIIAVVIPAVFNSFSMEQGGRFLRRVFDGYSLLTLGILLFLLVMVSLRYWQTAGSSQMLFPVTRTEVLLLLGMAMITSVIMGIVGPKTIALQEQAFEAVGELEKKTAYDQFFRMHMISRALYLVNVGLAAGLLVSKLRRVLVSWYTSREHMQNISS
ncbi:MAG: hypothetical protein NPIRA01_13560 [Nitrospirales bacterium]|nr:MAG: hypothetical protein NPIRA01_13560 [Nitrospirales bacterium]